MTSTQLATKVCDFGGKHAFRHSFGLAGGRAGLCWSVFIPVVRGPGAASSAELWHRLFLALLGDERRLRFSIDDHNAGGHASTRFVMLKRSGHCVGRDIAAQAEDPAWSDVFCVALLLRAVILCDWRRRTSGRVARAKRVERDSVRDRSGVALDGEIDQCARPGPCLDIELARSVCIPAPSSRAFSRD